MKREKKKQYLGFPDYLLLGMGTIALVLALTKFSVNTQTLILLGIAIGSYGLATKNKTWHPKDFGNLLILTACLGIMFININPYIHASYLIAVKSEGFVQLLKQIPIIGGLVSSLEWMGSTAIAIVPFSVILFLEITPTIMEGRRENLKATIEALKAGMKTSEPTDDPQIDKLQEKHDRFVVKLFEGFYQWRIAAYFIDFCVLTWYYCPFEKGWSDVFQWGIPGPDEILWLNIGAIVTVLLLFEVAVKLYFWLTNINTYLIVREEPQAWAGGRS